MQAQQQYQQRTSASVTHSRSTYRSASAALHEGVTMSLPGAARCTTLGPLLLYPLAPCHSSSPLEVTSVAATATNRMQRMGRSVNE